MQASSWGASVRMTQDAKVQRTDHGAETYVAQRRAVYDKHTPHPMRDGVGKFAGLHPLLGHYRSAAKEAAATHAEWERGVLRGNAARDAQLRFTQDHDIINKWPRVQQPPPPPPPKMSRTFGGGAPFHILSGEPIPIEQQSDAARAVRPARPMADYRPSLVRRRAVDITSNEYLVDDAGRKARDEAAERERAVRRYWQTHNFDPLTQTYCDPDKEAAAQHLAEASKGVQGLAQTARLPPSHRVSTGFAYDIVAHVARDAEALNTVDLMETRPWRIRTRLQTEERLRSAGEERSALESTRALNVVRTRKFEETFDARGYNILNGLGRPQDQLEHSLAGKAHELKAWDRIERDLLRSAPASLSTLRGAGAAAALGGGGSAGGSFDA